MILGVITFCKRATCPSSQILLAYTTHDLATEQSLLIEEHLDRCDFCGAEFQLLTRHAPLAESEEDCAPVDMPSSLRCLAQSLLTLDWLHIESLAEAACYKERLTLTDA
ncbi:MAG: hypothetical protein DMF68_19065 [Acidobacteria bacterium]|nr:MAG: hypothetical protein DMF68_19065 [Acidobacteriota bacterium]